MYTSVMATEHPSTCTPQHHAAENQQQHFSTPRTISAFNISAFPDEDWTKVSDVAERRRIQNRIAQRNYRKLLP
jgi:hypothetical protein